MIEKIEKIHKDFIWDSKKPKMKHSSMIGDYEEGGLKDIDIKAKFQSLHLSWIKRLFDKKNHPWKNIHSETMQQFYKIDIFYSNTILEKPPNLPLFYGNMIDAWNRLEQEPLTPETVLIQPVWFNRYIKIGNKPIKNFLMTPIFFSDIYAENGSITPWTRFKTKFQVSQNYYFK